MSSKFLLYKLLDENLMKEAGIYLSLPKLSYADVLNDEKTIELDDSYSYKINEYDSIWSPTENELQLTQSISIKHPSKLFGLEGVTAQENTLAIAVKIHSRTSNFTENLILKKFGMKDSNIEFDFEEVFEPNSLRGTIFFEYYLIVHELHNTSLFQADEIGMQLSSEPLLAYSVSVDGDGSEFPIEEFHDPESGLWRIWMDWVDVYSDSFDSSNIRILINSAHPLYDRLYTNTNKMNQYTLNNIIVSSIILVIQKAIIIDQNIIDEDMDAEPNSIAKAIWYWVSTFNIQIDSLEAISNSAHANLDPFSKE